MRIRTCAFSCSLIVLACGGSPAPGTGGESETGTGTESTGEPTSTTTTTTTTTSAGGCVAGMSIACACPDGGMGAQTCNDDGMSFTPCECTGSSMTGSTITTTTSGMTTTDMTTGVMTTGPMTTDMTTGMMGSSSSGGNACDDPGPEPNEDEASAVDLGDQDCQADAAILTGVLGGDTDSDWFRFHGIFNGMGCGFNDPLADLTLNAGGNVRLCAYAECDQSMVGMLQCQGGSQPDMSPDGRPGCCNTGDVAFQVNCVMNPDESATIFVRLDMGEADMCVDYSVEYSYQEA